MIHDQDSGTDRMSSLRWWHAAVSAGALLVSIVAFISADSTLRGAWSVAAITLFVITYATLGPAAVGRGRASFVFQALMVVATGAAAAASPIAAILQALVIPLVWESSRSRAQAIIGTAATTAVTLAGLTVSAQEPPWGILALTQVIAFVFSIGLGLWFHSIGRAHDARGALIDELRRTQAEVERVSAERGALAERARVAQDLHDTIAQDLAGIVLIAQRGLRTGDASVLGTVEDLAGQALRELRALAAADTPVALDDGLAAALDRLAARVAAQTGLAVNVQADATRLSPSTEVTLLRAAQEGLANVRHADARSVDIRLAVGPDEALLRIADDGRGFDRTAARRGLGLAGLEERAASIGGRADIRSGPHGTTLEVRVPAQEALR